MAQDEEDNPNPKVRRKPGASVHARIKTQTLLLGNLLILGAREAHSEPAKQGESQQRHKR